MSASPYKQLEQEFKRLHAFRGALALLRWDAAVMMPRGSADIRGEQLAALETEHHAASMQALELLFELLVGRGGHGRSGSGETGDSLPAPADRRLALRRVFLLLINMLDHMSGN